MAPPLSGLSVVLPAYNEEAVIAETVGKVLAFLGERKLPCEVLVVNDGSRDRTPDIVRELSAAHPEVRLINHEKNRGYGEAVRSGFDAATLEWVFLMDSDGQFDVTQLDEYFPLAEAHDMVLGYREHRADPWHRIAGAAVYKVVMNLLFGMSFKDLDCAFKLFRKSAWLAAQPVTSRDHKMFTVEWLWNSRRANLRITQIPARHYPRLKGTQTGAKPGVLWQMIKALVRLRFR